MGDRQDPLDDLLDDEELSLEEGGVPAEVRQRLVLALDVDDLGEARRPQRAPRRSRWPTPCWVW